MIIGRVGQGVRGLRRFSTVGAADRVVYGMYDSHRAEVISFQHQRDFAVPGYDMWRGGDEMRPQERDVVQ